MSQLSNIIVIIIKFIIVNSYVGLPLSLVCYQTFDFCNEAFSLLTHIYIYIHNKPPHAHKNDDNVYLRTFEKNKFAAKRRGQ